MHGTYTQSNHVEPWLKHGRTHVQVGSGKAAHGTSDRYRGGESLGEITVHVLESQDRLQHTRHRIHLVRFDIRRTQRPLLKQNVPQV